MMVSEKTATALQENRLSCVGVVVGPGTTGVFPIVAASLRAAGVSTVFRVDAHRPETSRSSPARRLLDLVDRILSRLLPGSSASMANPVPIASYAALPLEALLATMSLNGEPIDALIVIGETLEDIPTRFLGQAPSLYRICMGSSGDVESGQFGLTEVLNQHPVVMLKFQLLLPYVPAQLLAEMAVQTHVASATHTCTTLLATLPVFLESTLRRIKSTGPYLAVPASPDPVLAPSKLVVNLKVCLRHTSGLLRAVVDRIGNRFQWLLAVMPQPEQGDVMDWGRLRPLLPPADRFWADPFIVSREGRIWLFFEEAPFSSSKGSGIGHISVAAIDSSGFTSPVLRALDLPWHLSYPNVLEYKGEWYMIPESGSQKRIDLYQCNKWPDQWVHHSTLVDNYQGYDASILQVGDCYWMYVARRAPGVSTADLLDLFEAPSPLGPWRLHPSSPIVQDVRSARPGGRPFPKDGHWLRPAQDSSGGMYGRALRFQRIMQLDEQGYREQTEYIIEPNHVEGILGIHTFAATGDVVVVDLCRQVSRLPLIRRFQSKLPQRMVLMT